MRALEQQRKQLRAAVNADRQARHYRQLAQADQDKARAARDEIRALQAAEHARSRLAKLLRPRADQVARQVRDLTDVARPRRGQRSFLSQPHAGDQWLLSGQSPAKVLVIHQCDGLEGRPGSQPALVLVVPRSGLAGTKPAGR